MYINNLLFVEEQLARIANGKFYYEHTLQFQRMKTDQPINMPNIPSLVTSQVQVLEQNKQQIFAHYKK